VSSANKTGGAAFPIAKDAGYQTTVVVENGMTLLDYMAIEIMKVELSNYKSGIPFGDREKLAIAERSYKQSAAMIEERKKYMQP
jgi:hypothetical protein